MSAGEVEIASWDISDHRRESVPGGAAEPRYLPDGMGVRPLVGRVDERRLLARLLEAVRANESQTLVIVGEPGVGKTALLKDAIGAAPDFRVERAVGVQSEMELPFAALHQLCAPMLERLEQLPEPQSEALATAFGLSAGSPPDRFLVGLAVLGLLSEAAAEQPLLCVIDDAQWVDLASAQTLAFVARRVSAESVGILFATRHPSEELGRLPTLRLAGLDSSAARELLLSAVRSPLDESVRERIIAETRGNPLALLELPRRLTAVQLAGGLGMTRAQDLTGRIEESFIRRLDTLSDNTRRLLLVAAAEPVGDPLLFLRACERLAISVPTVDVESDGLLALGERVTFRHPLVRSAIYRSAAAQERRAVHLALAETTDQDADPDRRAWHLAAAAAGPDESVALELERSADRAQSRGGLAAAAAFLERAVVLTQDPSRRAERALAAAQSSVHAGAFDGALRLLATAELEPLDEFQRARVDLLRGHVAFASGNGDAPSLLLKAARRLEPFDVALARETYLNAWGAASMTAHLDRGGSLMAISRAIRTLTPPLGSQSPLDLLLDGLGLLATDGHAAATPTLQRASKALADIPVADVLKWGWASASASTAIWDDDGMWVIAARQVQLVRDAGALAHLPVHLSLLAWARAWMGDFPGAASLIAEVDGVTAATGSQIAPYALLKLRALQGREAEASAPIASAIEQGFAHAYVAAAVLYNGLARYEEAASAAREGAEASFEPWAYVWALPELVEAATRAGDATLARDALQRLVEATQPCGTDWALGIEARSRALITGRDTAESFYREAIDRLGRTRLRPELARAHLIYGEWLRREHRRVDARTQLRAAHDQLTSIGMEAFAERARRELRATGETARKRIVGTRDDLTPQERQVAQLASDGLSNAEIGARLFLSQHTVAYHLRKVFSKLDISSRNQLTNVLSASGHAADLTVLLKGQR